MECINCITYHGSTNILAVLLITYGIRNRILRCAHFSTHNRNRILFLAPLSLMLQCYYLLRGHLSLSIHSYSHAILRNSSYFYIRRSKIVYQFTSETNSLPKLAENNIHTYIGLLYRLLRAILTTIFIEVLENHKGQ